MGDDDTTKRPRRLAIVPKQVLRMACVSVVPAFLGVGCTKSVPQQSDTSGGAGGFGGSQVIVLALGGFGGVALAVGGFGGMPITPIALAVGGFSGNIIMLGVGGFGGVPDAGPPDAGPDDDAGALDEDAG